MSTESIVILDGAKRLPRADILIKNREPGLFSRFTTTQLGGMAIKATLEHTNIDQDKVGHVVMGMAQHSHRDSIYAAKGMAWRGGLGKDVPALTVARICGNGAEAVAKVEDVIMRIPQIEGLKNGQQVTLGLRPEDAVGPAGHGDTGDDQRLLQLAHRVAARPLRGRRRSPRARAPG